MLWKFDCSDPPLNLFLCLTTTAIEDLRKSINKLELRIDAIEKSGSAPVAGPSNPAPAPAKKEDDDDIDLFGSDEEDEEAGKLWLFNQEKCSQ